MPENIHLSFTPLLTATHPVVLTSRAGNREVCGMTIPAPSFRCELRRNRDVTAVVVDGELEEISAVQLAAACLHAGDVDGDGRISRDVGLDVAGVSFADGTGIQMIVTMHRAFEGAGHRLTIVSPSPRVQAEIDRMGLDSVLRVEPEMPVPAALTG